MTSSISSRFTPVDTYDGGNPVLFISRDASFHDLAICAAHRFTVVRDLMDTLSTIPLRQTDDCDLLRVTRVAHLLMREGRAVLDVIQTRAAQVGCQ
ncbi:hypothetical protein AB3464_18450 [Pseudomonas asplenii]|uniref:hypothetical protein n=1 Tax=Pseudomonas asplenii TaxID=53407 RepID=UPI0037CB5783